MAFVPDSRYKGYLGPHTTPAPLNDGAWDDFLHDLIVGISGMPGDKVFPRRQSVPPVHPHPDVDWAAIGISELSADWQAHVRHYPASDEHPDGYDALQHMETTTFLTSFYGPNCARNATVLRAGFQIEQNLAELRRANVGLVEVQTFVSIAELFKQKWLGRIDVPIVLRREIRFDYPVLNLLSVTGTITGDYVQTDFDTQEN